MRTWDQAWAERQLIDPDGVPTRLVTLWAARGLYVFLDDSRVQIISVEIDLEPERGDIGSTAEAISGLLGKKFVHDHSEEMPAVMPDYGSDYADRDIHDAFAKSRRFQQHWFKVEK